jgi:predicted ATPase
LSWALWHRGYPDQSARAADRALAYSRALGHAHTLAHALFITSMAAVLARDVATVYAYGNDCVAISSEHGFAYWAANGRILQAWADTQRVKRREELPTSATVWRHPRRPAATTPRYSSPCWPRRWRLPEK